MTKQIEVREGARRQHRSIALLCAMKCHYYDWDGVQIRRGQLDWILGLKRFKETRRKWMEDDFADLFPFQNFRMVDSSGDSGTLHSITLSKLPSTENTKPLIGKFDLGSPPDDLYPDLKDNCLHIFGPKSPELIITSILTMLAHGQISLSDVFGRDEKPDIPCPELLDFRQSSARPAFSCSSRRENPTLFPE